MENASPVLEPYGNGNDKTFWRLRDEVAILVQVVPLALMRLPEVVASAAISVQILGTLKVQVPEEDEMERTL